MSNNTKNLSDGVIAFSDLKVPTKRSAEGSRAGTLPGHFARCFTMFSMTRDVFGNVSIIANKKSEPSVKDIGAALNVMVCASMLLLCLHGCCLDGEAGLVVLDVGIEAGYVFGSGGYLFTGVAAEYYLFEVIFE